MKIVDNILQVLQEQRGFTPHKTPPKNIKNILSQIQLFEMYPKIYALVIKDDRLRARVFMRYQEFYESDSDSFRGQGFKWYDYVKFYKEKTKNDYFSYHEDWAGYNIPCTSIESCIAKIPDINYFDLIMFSVVDTIKSIVGNDNYYLIGIDQSTGEDPSLIYHEVAHGLWFVNPIYRTKQFKNIETMNPQVRNAVAKKITGMGYGQNVIDDEIQAYLSTGIGDNMKRIKDIKQAQIPFVNTFDSYSGKIKPKKIQIDWSTDLDK
jgi:hypothetical protein